MGYMILRHFIGIGPQVPLPVSPRSFHIAPGMNAVSSVLKMSVLLRMQGSTKHTHKVQA